MERCANRLFLPVEGDGYDAVFHGLGRKGPGVPLSAQPRPRVSVAKWVVTKYERSEVSAGSGARPGLPAR